MTEVQMSSDLKVKLIRHCADDLYVIEAAQLSTAKYPFGEWDLDEGLDPNRFLNALMQPRHGVPWEHTFFTFAVEVPIFVVRQWVKSRLTSMNEMSGRYTQMIPKFYTLPAQRPIVNIGTKMKPRMVTAELGVFLDTRESDRSVAQTAWDAYTRRLNNGVAEEYARTILPLSTYTQFYWSLNGRALMNFLERRVDSEDARVPTHPQWEIDFAARELEKEWAKVMPISHAAFIKNGRVAP